MISIYTKIYEELLEKEFLSESEIISRFFFLISFSDWPSHRVRKELLNIPINGITEFTGITTTYYVGNVMIENFELKSELCKAKTLELKLSEVLKYLGDAMSSFSKKHSTSKIYSKWTSDKSFGETIVFYTEVDKENGVNFSFGTQIVHLKDFIMFCFKKLAEIDYKLLELENFMELVNEKFSYKSVPSGRKQLYCQIYIIDYFIDKEGVEFLIIEQSWYSNDTDSSSKYIVPKSLFIKTLFENHSLYKDFDDIIGFCHNYVRNQQITTYNKANNATFDTLPMPPNWPNYS
jgi:hypothetical protein